MITLKYYLLPPIFCDVCCNFSVFLGVRCLDWNFVGCDIMWSCKETPKFWSSLVPPSLGFKANFGPEYGWRKHVPSKPSFTRKTAQLHTPENSSLNFEVRCTVNKRINFYCKCYMFHSSCNREE